MYAKQWTVVSLSAGLLFSCAHSPDSTMRLETREERIAAYEAETRTAVIEEKTIPILLGIYAGATLPSVFRNLAPETEAGLVYWEWVEISGGGGGVHRVIKTAYGQLSPEGVEFPFAKELDYSKLYTGIKIKLSFLYKKSTGQWLQQLVVPGILSNKTSPKKLNPPHMSALRYADENIQLIDTEMIPAANRAAVIANTFELLLLP